MIECISYPFRLTLDRWVMELIELVFRKSDQNHLRRRCRPNQYGAKMMLDCLTKLLLRWVIVEKNLILGEQEKNMKMVNDEIMEENCLSMTLE